MKILYFDVETTGLNPRVNDIVQLAGIIEIDGEIKERFNYRIQPFSFENISQEALDITGNTIEGLKNHTKPFVIYKELINMFSRYVDKFNKADKFVPVGYNVNFDIGFLREWFIKNGDLYYGSWINYKYVDPLAVFYMLESIGKVNYPDYKLSTVCEHLGFSIDAHDALSDISATRDVYKYLVKQLGG